MNADLPRPYSDCGTEELSTLFAAVCLSGDREAYALVVHEMGFRGKFRMTMDAFDALGAALLDRSSPGVVSRESDVVSVVHAVLGMGCPMSEDRGGAAARSRIRELQKDFHSDRFANGEPKVQELANRFMSLLNSMVELLPTKHGV